LRLGAKTIKRNGLQFPTQGCKPFFFSCCQGLFLFKDATTLPSIPFTVIVFLSYEQVELKIGKDCLRDKAMVSFFSLPLHNLCRKEIRKRRNKKI